jgi:hypothetical protein
MQAGARVWREAMIFGIDDDREQLLLALTADRRDDAELRHVPRSALESWVRCRQRTSRTPCSIIALCCSGSWTLSSLIASDK